MKAQNNKPAVVPKIVPHDSKVQIALDRPRTIEFTMGAVWRIKANLQRTEVDADGKATVTKENVIQWQPADWQRIINDPEAVPIVLWATLVNEDKDLTPEIAAEIMGTAAQYLEVAGALMKSWALFSGLSEEDLDEAIAKSKGQGQAIPENPQTATA